MNIQNLFDYLFLFHEAASKFFELFILDITSEVEVDESNYNTNNYCEEDRRGTYMHYRDHLDD
jgi:hypothetical protein